VLAIGEVTQTGFPRKFLKGLQTAKDEADAKYGGVGYDGKSRPDLSNTQMFIDGLLAAGVQKNDPAIQNALKFVSRCQNLPGEQNDLAFAKKATEDDKGGFVYNPLDPDEQDRSDEVTHHAPNLACPRMTAVGKHWERC
jgi:squalene-hopene/tetraprenyl-beta-curcumene cyclase